MRHLIERAVLGRRAIQLHCRDRDRIVEPHAYGLDRSGEAVLVCYQADDTAQRGAAGGWLRIRLREVLDAAETTKSFFAPRSGYVRNDPGFEIIYAQI